MFCHSPATTTAFAPRQVDGVELRFFVGPWGSSVIPPEHVEHRAKTLLDAIPRA
jgi:hypothetical protein